MLVNTGGQVKLCDFGVSTQVGLFSAQPALWIENHLGSRQTGTVRLLVAGHMLFIFNLWARFLHQNMIVHCLMTVKTADIVITTYK